MTKEMQRLLDLKNTILAEGDSAKKAENYEELSKVNEKLDKVYKDIENLEKFEKRELDNLNPLEPEKKETKVFKSLGEQLKAIYNASRGNVDPRLNIVNEAQGWNTATETGGGYAIQSDFAIKINERIRSLETENAILNMIPEYTISSNSNKAEFVYVDETNAGVANGGVIAYWTKEAEEIQKSHPKLLKVKIELEKLAALSYATEEQLEDFSATESFFYDSFALAIIQAEIKGVFSGSGLDEPKGITSADSLISVKRKTAGQLSVEDILNMQNHVIPSKEANYVWVLHPDLKTKLPLLNYKAEGDTVSHLLFMPAGGISGTPYDTLSGKRIIYCEYAGAIGTKGDVMYIDFTEFMKVVKGGTRFDTSIHVQFLTDQTAFRVIKRENFAPKRDKVYKLNNSQVQRSSFIALDATVAAASTRTAQ